MATLSIAGYALAGAAAAGAVVSFVLTRSSSNVTVGLAAAPGAVAASAALRF
jgi:hypothetical protein